MNLKLLVAVLLIAVVPAYAQTQSPSAPKVGDAQKVVTIIRGDKAKTRGHVPERGESEESPFHNDDLWKEWL
jgi:hypothetical protein